MFSFIYWIILLHLYAASGVCMRVTELSVPTRVDPRAAAALRCAYELEGDRLHSLKWYHGTDEIFRYVPSQQPNTRSFGAAGVRVEAGACEEGACTLRVLLRAPPAAARLRCELSSEGPHFYIVQQTADLELVAEPQSDPVISGLPNRVMPGDEIRLNCTTDYSLPPAEIVWYINDMKAPTSSMSEQTFSAASSHGLSRTARAFRWRAGGGELRVACQAAQPDSPGRSALALLSPAAARHEQALISMYTASRGTRPAAFIIVLLSRISVVFL